MIPLLPLSLAGGALVVGWRQQRRPKARLIDTLAPITGMDRTAARAVAHLFVGSPEQNLALSAGLLGLTVVGHLGLPVLRLVALPGLCYLDGCFIHAAYSEWRAERRVTMTTSDAVLATGLLVTRQWGANSLFTTLFFTSHTLHAKSLQQLSVDDGLALLASAENGDANDKQLPLVRQPAPSAASTKAQWQRLVDQGALPLLTLSAISMPWLGAKRALAVLLTNFGYDYRITAPISTLSYLASARQQGIWLRDGHALEVLQQVDVLLIDAAWAATKQTGWHADPTLTLIVIAPDTTDLARLIAEQQAAGHLVAYLGGESTPLPCEAQPDLWISAASAAASGVAIRLPADQPAPLEALLALRTALAANRKRGLYLALAPSVINLSGIYFLRFGVITTLLVDYGGAAAGMLNALGPRLRPPKALTTTAEKETTLSVV
jgi:hypothetical protein